MFSTPVLLKVPGNQPGLVSYFDGIEKAAHPTVGDLLYAGQRERSRILARTARGIDADETAFAPYSTNGPYYYYPNKGSSARGRAASAGALARKLGVAKTGTTGFGLTKGASYSKAGTFTHKSQGAWHNASRTRLGIKFSSYAAFKQFLGRGGVVDLRGIKAPHMLQAMIVKVGGITIFNEDGSTSEVQGELFTGDSSNNQLASEIIIGIYGDEAERAEGHNQGTRNLPRRHFLGASDRDKILILGDIARRVGMRMKIAIGGTQ